MCQLLAMNCNRPTDINFSFEGFRLRGGCTDQHVDGFGIAFYEKNGLRVFRDNASSATSPVADLVERYPICSCNIIGHIRRATVGRAELVNIHPFVRELWGQYWCFAHNGHMHVLPECSGLGRYTPVGSTDSEYIFCHLLNHLAAKFLVKPSREDLFAEIAAHFITYDRLGIFNCILSNGEWLIAHASTLLHYVLRAWPFGVVDLIDEHQSRDFSVLTQPDDRVAVLATLPLSKNEHWQQLAVHETLMFADGVVCMRQSPKHRRLMSREEGLAIAHAVALKPEGISAVSV